MDVISNFAARYERTREEELTIEEEINQASMDILIDERAPHGIHGFICKEREFILLHKKIFCERELEELRIWTSLIIAVSRYPRALFIYDEDAKLKLLSIVRNLEAKLSNLVQN